MNRVMYNKRIGDWSNVPNSNVNDDGKPNLNNSNAENNNDARVLVMIEVILIDTFTPATNLAACFSELCLKFQSIGIIDEIEFQQCSQFECGEFCAGIRGYEVRCFVAFWCVFCKDKLLQGFTTTLHDRFGKGMAVFLVHGRDERRQLLIYFIHKRDDR